MGSFVMAEIDVEESALYIWEAMNEMHSICDELSMVMLQLTCQGGGLESSNMKDVFESRASEISSIGNLLSEQSKTIIDEVKKFVDEVQSLDSGDLTLRQ